MIERGFYRQLISELRREYLIWRSYRVNAVSSLVMWGVVFPILMVTLISAAANAGINYSASLQAASLIGFLIWKLCSGVLIAIPHMIEEEASTGTLENVMVTSYIPFPLLFFFRVIARSIRSCLEVFLLGLGLTLIFRLPLTMSPTALLVTFLTLVGVWGVGFALAGLAMVYKNIGSVTSLVVYLAFTISGAFVPLNALTGLFTVLKVTFPMTWGIDILRRVMIDGYDFSFPISDGSLPGLFLQSMSMLLIGYIILYGALNRVKQRGELGVY